MKSQKRVNRSKKDIISDIQLVQAADRRRSLIRDIIFPYLVSLDETISYSKVFLQAMSGLIEGVLEEERKKISINDIYPQLEAKLNTVFAKSDPEQSREHGRYIALIDKMKEISVQDFTYAAELPRYIDGWTTKTEGAKKVNTVSIDEILG